MTMVDEIFYVVVEAVGEVITSILSKVIGRTFSIEAKEARRIGELAILLTLVGLLNL